MASMVWDVAPASTWFTILRAGILLTMDRHQPPAALCACRHFDGAMTGDARPPRRDDGRSRLAPAKAGLAIGRSAVISRCGRYRYVLEREWDHRLPAVLFIALNPSTADATNDDPTVRRCVGFARKWGFGKLVLANLFALRSSDPMRLAGHADPIGPRNDRWLARLSSSFDLTVAAWGVRGDLNGRAAAVLPLLRQPHHLGLTRAGHPRHPLYLPAAARPICL